jgi:protein-disulfide isomerase
MVTLSSRCKMVLLAAVTVSFLSACGGSPLNKEKAAASIKKIMPVNFEILAINKIKDIPGLNEVVVRVGSQTIVLYVDNKAKYLVSGTIMSTETSQNLTLETQKKYAQ